MVLRDVREKYTVRLREEVPREDGPGTRTKIRLDARERTVQQAFLRGEQVVTVALEGGVGEGQKTSDAEVATEREEMRAARGGTRDEGGDARGARGNDGDEGRRVEARSGAARAAAAEAAARTSPRMISRSLP